MIEQYVDEIPEVTWYPAYDNSLFPGEDIKAFTYSGAVKDGKPSRVFAYISYPKGAKKGDKLPAIVLVHGGGGHAFATWIKEWTNRGYVALAMDNTGFFPNDTKSLYAPEEWSWGLEGNPDFYVEDHANLPMCDGMHNWKDKIETQWMYYAVTDVILAYNLLCADKTVDAGKVGIYGISWGSVITNIAMGYKQFGFAICQYCAGYLNESVTSMPWEFNGHDDALFPWRAEDRYNRYPCPILYIQWTYDMSASCDTTSMCYMANREHSILSLHTNWLHSHDWTKFEPYRFADNITKGTQPLLTIVQPAPSTKYFGFNVLKPADATDYAATIYYTTKPLREQFDGRVFNDDTWQAKPAMVDDNICHGILPDDAYMYYVDITYKADGVEYHTATNIAYAK